MVLDNLLQFSLSSRWVGCGNRRWQFEQVTVEWESQWQSNTPLIWYSSLLRSPAVQRWNLLSFLAVDPKWLVSCTIKIKATCFHELYFHLVLTCFLIRLSLHLKLQLFLYILSVFFFVFCFCSFKTTCLYGRYYTWQKQNVFFSSVLHIAYLNCMQDSD